MGIFNKKSEKSNKPEEKKLIREDINAKVDALIFKLKDPDSSVHESSVREMIALGKPAVGPLIQYLQHPDLWARLMAAAALGKMRDQRAIEPLKHALDDPDEGVRHMVKTALKELLPEGKEKEIEPAHELQNLKIKISELPKQYPAGGISVGPGVGQAQEQISIICRNIDDAIRALNTGLDPYNRPITKSLITDGLRRLVDATRKSGFAALMLGVLSSDGILLLESYLNELEQIANRIS